MATLVDLQDIQPPVTEPVPFNNEALKSIDIQVVHVKLVDNLSEDAW